jgi:hypothetical protein
MGLGLAASEIFSDASVEILRWKHFSCQYFNDGSSGNIVARGSALTDSGTKASVTQTTTQLNGSKYTTGAVSGNSAGALLDAIHSRAHFLLASFQITLVTVANVRISLGMASTTVANMVVSATPAQNYFGFRFDTGASDTTWRCMSDNGSGTPTNLDSGVSVAAGEYLMQITTDPTGNKINYFINRNFVGANSATLPATSVVTLSPYAGLATLAASAANFNVHFINGRSRVGNF